jgi:hypothetical protein
MGGFIRVKNCLGESLMNKGIRPDEKKEVLKKNY